jgi:pilus assembly protein CpaE
MHQEGDKDMLTAAQVVDAANPASKAETILVPGAKPNEAAAPRARVPRIGIHAFCETAAVAAVVQAAAAQRAMANAQVQVHWGRPSEALNILREDRPDLVVVESRGGNLEIMPELERLAAACHPEVRVIVIGHENDIDLYRELMRQGVSEYLVAPTDPRSLVGAVCAIYADPTAAPLGRTFACIGAKGGVGSSTVAHNLAWAVAALKTDVILADLDAAFGTAALDFNVEPAGGLAEATKDAERLDQILLERLLIRSGEHLNLLTAPGRLDCGAELGPAAVEQLLQVAQTAAPFLVLDLPHVWTPWMQSILAAADEVIITAMPDLANLRNAKNLVAFLQEARPDQPPPKLLLNQVGTPKRPEIKASDFAEALQIEPVASLSFEPHLYGTAANKGQMIAQTSPTSSPARAFEALARELTGRSAPKRRGGALPGIGSLLRLLRR